MDFIWDLFEIILTFFNFTGKTKLQKNIEQLTTEDWFKPLYDDIRYSYIIWNNKKVKRFLLKTENVKLLKTDEEIRNQFISLVKIEHKKYMKKRIY